MRNEFREIEKTLQLINEQRKAAEEKLKYIVNMAIVDASKDYPVKRLGPKIISVRFSDIIGNPWNQQYYDWVEASKVVMKYLNEQDADKWKDKLIELFGGDTESRKPVMFKNGKGGCFYQIPVNRKFIVKIIEKL